MSAGAKSMEFNPSGALVWVGDEKVQIQITYCYSLKNTNRIEKKFQFEKDNT